MAKRITYTPEEKQVLIEKYLPEYLASKRSAINGKKATKELFDELPEEEQWMKIYVNYVRKQDELPNKSSEVNPTTFTYNTVRFAINTLKKSVDVMNAEQIKKMFTELEELQVLVDSKEKRKTKEEIQRLNDEEKYLLKKLQENKEMKDELEKILV